MCGILGGWIADGISRAAIDDALDRLRHRGPDDAGLHQAPPSFLGMRRLSIIDLEGGHQPIFNEDHSVSVVFNGEIYNYLELISDLKAKGHQFRTLSDTEVLVHLYEERGEEMVECLRGMFAFAIWDERQKRFFIARDRFGKKPLYYTRTRSGGFLFASEVKALMALAHAAGERWRVRDQSIYDFLSLSTVPQPATVYEGVSMLSPANWLTFDGDKLSQRCYWHLKYAPKIEIPYRDVLEQTRALVGESVQLRLRSDVPLGIFLSGGIDSSVIAYEAAQRLKDSVETFTVSMSHSHLDEARVAQRTAMALGLRNTVIPLEISPVKDLQFLVRHYDQPFADSSAIATFAISRLARQYVKVILNGDGGDELFAGYRRYLAAHWLHHFGRMPRPVFELAASTFGRVSSGRRTSIGFTSRFLRGATQEPGLRFLTWTTDMLVESDKVQFWKCVKQRSTESLIQAGIETSLGPLDLQRDADLDFVLASTLLVKMDMASMAASLEARSPLLDSVLAEFTAKLPAAYLLHGGVTKAVLRDSYRGRLPDEVIKGRKQGFEVPLVQWLTTEWRSLIYDSIGAKNARVRSYLSDELVDGLLANNILPQRNWAQLLYALLVLELWLREDAQTTSGMVKVATGSDNT